MSRITLALLVGLMAVAPAAAQDVAPPAPQGEVTIDPRASLTVQPKSASLLMGLYATQATLDICAVPPVEPASTNMSAHRRQLEAGLGLNESAGEEAYQDVRADVEKAGVDCAEASADRQQADAVLALYSGQR